MASNEKFVKNLDNAFFATLRVLQSKQDVLINEKSTLISLLCLSTSKWVKREKEREMKVAVERTTAKNNNKGTA